MLITIWALTWKPFQNNLKPDTEVAVHPTVLKTQYIAFILLPEWHLIPGWHKRTVGEFWFLHAHYSVHLDIIKNKTDKISFKNSWVGRTNTDIHGPILKYTKALIRICCSRILFIGKKLSLARSQVWQLTTSSKTVKDTGQCTLAP